MLCEENDPVKLRVDRVPKQLVDGLQVRADVVHVHAFSCVQIQTQVAEALGVDVARVVIYTQPLPNSHGQSQVKVLTVLCGKHALEQLMTKPPSALWLKECGRLAHISHSFQ